MHLVCVELVEQHGSTRSSRHVERVVSRRDVASEVEFGLIYVYCVCFVCCLVHSKKMNE